MKKAAIISLYGNYNFGNKLQSYAVQEVLKKYGLEVENIANIPIFNNRKSSFTEKKSRLIFKVLNLMSKIKKNNALDSCIDPHDSLKRQNAFLQFNEKINNTDFLFTFSKVNKLKKYDYFFVGSDQIWNPNLGGLSDLDLLTFTDSKQKIAFCASFGIDTLPIQNKEKIKKELEKFKAISVREEQAKKMIQEIIPTKNIFVLVDPTMLLDCEEWNEVSIRPLNYRNKPYVLCYFLGDVSESQKKFIKEFAIKNSLDIIDILDPLSEFYSSGPGEFVYLESHASFIFTDSFHSTVFAILYNIPFIVFDRKGHHANMNSRIITLLKKFELESRIYRENEVFENYDKIDFNKVDKILEKEREKAFQFLNDNI